MDEVNIEILVDLREERKASNNLLGSHMTRLPNPPTWITGDTEISTVIVCTNVELTDIGATA